MVKAVTAAAAIVLAAARATRRRSRSALCRSARSRAKARTATTSSFSPPPSTRACRRGHRVRRRRANEARLGMAATSVVLLLSAITALFEGAGHRRPLAGRLAQVCDARLGGPGARGRLAELADPAQPLAFHHSDQAPERA